MNLIIALKYANIHKL